MKTATLTFSDYRKNAPHDSEAWATTDRGWAWDAGNDQTCFAHYLDYEHGSSTSNGKTVHVVICGASGANKVIWVKRCAAQSDARLKHFPSAGRARFDSGPEGL